MQRPLSLVGAAMLSVAALATAASTAAANPPGNLDCPPGQIAVDGHCVSDGDPPPPTPTLKVELAQQTTDRTGVHLRGYATATDTTKALSVQFTIDGVVKTATANVSRTDVGNHGYDLTIPAARTATQVCVMATDPQDHQHTTICKTIDRVKQFDATSISYDLAHASIDNSSLDQLDTVTQTNATNVRQQTTISGSQRLTDSSSWSDTQDLTVYIAGDVSIPVVGGVDVEVTDHSTFVQNGSTETTRKFSWEQPVVVPAQSQVVTTVTVTRSTLTVPYTLSGSYEYDSGAKVAGTLDGTYHGVDSHDLEVTITQTDLDGARAASPVGQPKPQLRLG